MSRTVTVSVPDEVFERARNAADAEGIRVEDAFQRSLRAFWLSSVPGDTGLESDREKRGLVAASVDSADWWDAPEDQEWDRWQPSP